MLNPTVVRARRFSASASGLSSGEGSADLAARRFERSIRMLSTRHTSRAANGHSPLPTSPGRP